MNEQRTHGERAMLNRRPPKSRWHHTNATLEQYRYNANKTQTRCTRPTRDAPTMRVYTADCTNACRTLAHTGTATAMLALR
eukprot:6307550-Lingulodinium_polyedra.AAC.1